MHNDATVLIISIKDESQGQAVKLVNALTNMYVQSNLDFKNTKSVNAIEFIDDQLYGITDSLHVTEKRLQTYRETNHILNVTDVSSKTFDQIYDLDKQKR